MKKFSLLSTSQSAIPRLGIKEYQVGGEAAHGVVDRKGGKTTVFPQPIGLSCTWNRELMKKVGSVIGDEARIFYEQNQQKTGLTLWAHQRLIWNVIRGGDVRRKHMEKILI